MSFTETQLMAWLGAFIWPLARVGALVATAPIFSSRQTPVTLRLAFILVLSWVLMPLIPTPEVVEFLSFEAVLILVQQLLIGLVMGFMLQLVFGALVFGGQVLAYSMGLGFASMMDPQNGVQVPVVSQFYLIIATIFFLAINGHLVLLEMLAESFYVFPVSTVGVSGSGLEAVVAWGSDLFVGGLLMALPVMAALLLVNLGLGVIGRAAPALNIFAVGFPVTIILGFILILVTLPDVMAVFQDLLEQNYIQTRKILGF